MGIAAPHSQAALVAARFSCPGKSFLHLQPNDVEGMHAVVHILQPTTPVQMMSM